MDRVVLVGIFKALKALSKNKQYDDMNDIINAVLEEAQATKSLKAPSLRA